MAIVRVRSYLMDILSRARNNRLSYIRFMKDIIAINAKFRINNEFPFVVCALDSQESICINSKHLNV